MDKDKMLTTLKLDCFCVIAGVICMFVAFFLPEASGETLRTGLLVFGAVLAAGSALQTFSGVYKPLKEEHEKD